MKKFDRVLSEGYLRAITEGLMWSSGDSIGFGVAVAGAVQEAILEKLDEQEPVAWSCLDTHTGIAHLTQSAKESQALSRVRRFHVAPLYAQPMPCVSQISNKIACVSESGESDTQASSQVNLDSSKGCDDSLILELARFQPCGCVVCYCENQVQCLGCGARYCGTHEVGEIPNPVYVDHIPDAGKMITPLAQRKIQSLLDNGEYRVIENATVLVNERGHAAIVNHGGAFYWVENKALAREYDGRAMPVEASLPGPKKKVNLSLTIDTKEVQALLQSYLDSLDGWQLVPVEPTQEMVQAADKSDEEYSKRNFNADVRLCQSGYDHYLVMLAAAPKYTGDSNE